ncbi:hypothetical protein QR680_011532 [Steinernema hermaphroditum]|uniref:ASD2 domain-containing protein n=1 Tax=Steinernema hermaphroditum TaxID=289476 RepID=A0AA39HYT4_9BILA|nr:hypothetical protein QR680_011532 [Steinernema hermaphroditum]
MFQPRRVAAHFGVDDPPTMLRRCPSGARKKIRQRREEQQVQSSIFASSTNLSSYSSSSSTSTAEAELQKFDYRSLLNSGGYKSILPDDTFEKPKPRFTSSMTSLYSPSMVDITIPDTPTEEAKDSPPLPLPRSRPSSFDESFESTSEVPSTVAPPTPTSANGKPTVQVLPMPAQRQFPVIEPPEVMKAPPPLPAKRDRPKPPPVPKKPLGLTNKLAMQRAQMSKSCASMDSLSTSSSPPLSKLAPSPLSSSGFFSSVQSQECLNRLCASPSLLSLQTALRNPQALSAEEIENLEDRRHQLVESMTRKVAILDEERQNIDDELESNEEFRASTFAVVLEQKPFLVKRIQSHLNQSMQMSALEARLRDQVEKIDQALAGNNDESEFLSLRRQRLQDQFNDIAFLKSASDKRDDDITAEVEKAFDHDITLMEQWRYYKETLIKLNVEKRQIADRLNVAKSQLKSLETLSI